jgi:hypothetical protein
MPATDDTDVADVIAAAALASVFGTLTPALNTAVPLPPSPPPLDDVPFVEADAAEPDVAEDDVEDEPLDVLAVVVALDIMIGSSATDCASKTSARTSISVSRPGW